MFWELQAMKKIFLGVFPIKLEVIPIKLEVANHDGCNKEAISSLNYLSTLLCGYNGDKSGQKSFYEGMCCSVMPIKAVSRGTGT